MDRKRSLNVSQAARLSFDVAELVKTLSKGPRRLRVGRVEDRQDTDPPNLSRLLRLGEPRSKNADESGQKRSPVHDTSTERAGGTPGL